MRHFRLGSATVDLDARTVDMGEERLPLTEMEASLLDHLSNYPDQAVSRDELLEKVWGYGQGVLTRTIDTTVRRLRAKIEPDRTDPVHLLTVYRVGYRLAGVQASVGSTSRHHDHLVGRDGDLDGLVSLLETHHLVSLIGTAGVGKSALAKEAAEVLGADAYLCDLALDTNADAVAHTLTAALGTTGLRSLSALGQQIRERGPCTIVFDNADGALSVLIPWLPELAAAAPQARFLVTTRERTHLDGEHVLRLEPLDPVSAAALFERAARAVEATWAFAPHERPIMMSLMEQLDGNPLAIELAASRTTLMPLQALHRRLLKSADFLVRPGGRAARHDSLHHAVDGSWRLLNQRERVVLRHCVLFEGSFSMACLESMIGGDDALEVLTSLVDKSVIQRVRRPHGTRLRAYAAVRSAVRAGLSTSHELEPAETAHARGVVEHLRPVLDDWRGPRDCAAGLALVDELETLQAIATRLGRHDPEAAMAAALGMQAALMQRGPLVGQPARLQALLALDLSDGLRASGLLALGDALRLRGHQGAAVQAGLDALGLGQLTAELQVHAHVVRSAALHRGGDRTAAREAAHSAQRLAETLDSPHALGLAADQHGMVCLHDGDPEGALPWFERAASQHHRAHDTDRQVHALFHLAQAQAATGNTTPAHTTITQALAWLDPSPPPRQTALLDLTRGHIARATGELDEAIHQYGRAVRAYQALGYSVRSRDAVQCVAQALIDQGELDEAEALAAQALRASQDSADQLGERVCRAQLQHIAALRA